MNAAGTGTATMDEFLVPAEPAELWGDSDLPFKVLNLQDLSESSQEEIAELAEGERCSLGAVCSRRQPRLCSA